MLVNEKEELKQYLIEERQTVKSKYGFLPTSVWHLKKDRKLIDFIGDNGDVENKKRRSKNSWLPNLRYSSFNPKVADRVIKYWSNKGDIILDPFAGRSTRMIMSKINNRNYIGFDISPIAIDELKKTLNKQETLSKIDVNIKLFCSDGCEMKNIQDYSIDLIFTCPPYWNLEKYESVDNQLSDCKSYMEFLNKLYECVGRCHDILKKNKFSIWVVSDFRKGYYYCLHKDLIDIHLDSGFILWDIIINVLNSPFISFKAGFNDNQKYTGKTHEYILVFKKL